MRVQTAKVYLFEIEFRQPIVAAHGVWTRRIVPVLELGAGGHFGYAEGVMEYDTPTYSPESFVGSVEVLTGLCGSLEHQLVDPSTFAAMHRSELTTRPMAFSMVEMALTELWCSMHDVTLRHHLGARVSPLSVGTTLSTPVGRADGVDRILECLRVGYSRVRLKLTPENFELVMATIRRVIDLGVDASVLAVDANQSFLEDADRLVECDQLGLAFIEQPLPANQVRQMAELMHNSLSTPICLDESLDGLRSLEAALSASSRFVFSLKPSRFGGFGPTIEAISALSRAGCDCFIGGMFETSLGRHHNALLAARDTVSLASDLSPPSDYLIGDVSTSGFEAPPDVYSVGVAGFQLDFDERYLDRVLTLL